MASVVLAPSRRPETLALLAAMTSRPDHDSVRARLIDDLMRRIIAEGVWARLGNLYVLAAHDAQAARLNWVLPGTADLSEVSAPAFVADRGYTGDGSTSYLTSGALVRSPYALNDAHAGVWVNTNVAEAGNDLGGVSGAQLRLATRSATDTIAYRMNNSTSGSVTSITDARGHTMLNRTGSTAGDVYKNGADVGNFATNVTTATLSGNLAVCRGDAVAFSTKQIGAAHAGSQLTATETAALYRALLAYMTAVGNV